MVRYAGDRTGYQSSRTSSMRQPLKWLLVIVVSAVACRSQIANPPVPTGLPSGRQIRQDRGKAVLRHALVEDDEIVETAYQRDLGRDPRFLVQRHARRASNIEHLQAVSGHLRKFGADYRYRDQRRSYQRPGDPSQQVSSSRHCLSNWPPRGAWCLFVEPEVLEARAVVDAVDHQGEPLHPGLPANCRAGVIDDRSDIVLRQFPFDFPNQLPPLLPIGFH